METIKSKLGLALVGLLMLLTMNASANQKFTKKLHQEYNSSASTIVGIFNKFGDVTIKDWDQNKVVFDVIITVEEDNQKDAEEIFKKISVTFTQEAEMIKALTEITESIKNTEFRIDYEVSMPKNLRLNLANKYGSVFINELTNIVDIRVAYGSLKANNLTNGKTETKSQITLEYSSGTIEKGNWLKVSSSFSSFNLNEANAVMLMSKYSKIDMTNINSMVADSKYDNPFNIESIDNLIITDGKYSTYTIGTLKTRLDMNIKYSDCNIEQISNNFDNVNIDLKYGNVRMGMDPESSYKIEAQSEYGNVFVPDSEKLLTVREKFSSHISGQVGNGKSKSQMKLATKYGDINIQ